MKLSITSALVAFATGLLAACGSLQRLPGPMPFSEEDPDYLSGPPVVRLVRHGDPVQWRPAGEAGSVMLAFYDKEAQLSAGSWVFLGAPGRAELLRPNDGSSAILFGISAVEVGDGRQEPWLKIVQLDRVRLLMVPGDRVALPGGAQLEAMGEGGLPVGPFLLTSTSDDVYRLHNQGSLPGRVRYRDQILVVAPSERIGLARIDPQFGGTEPLLATTREVPLGDRRAEVLGEVAFEETGAGTWRFIGRGAGGSVFVQGLRLDLADGEEVTWRFPAETASEP